MQKIENKSKRVCKIIVLLLLLVILVFIGLYYTLIGDKVVYSFHNIQDYFMEKHSFEANQLLLKVYLDGENVTKSITFYNMENYPLNLSLDTNLDNIKLNEEDFVLDGSKELFLEFEDNGFEGVKIGKLLINSDDYQMTIPLIEEFEDKLDLGVSLTPENRAIQLGETVSVDIDLFNLDNNYSDVQIEYLLYDLDGELFFSEMENRIITEETNYVKSLWIPRYLREGQYLFVVKITDGSNIGLDSYLFDVYNDQLKGIKGILNDYGLLLLIILMILLDIYVILKLSRKQTS